MTPLPPVLDACCGPRMFWHDKADPRAVFVDRRNESYEIPPDRAYPNGTTIHVRPDVVADFTALPFPDDAFWHVVFDPPHILRSAELGTVTKKYGCLNGDWESMLAGGFRECFRVLRPGGTLIFKWCDTQIPLKRVLALTPERPLYGHRGGQKSVTHWVAFLKPPRPEPWLGKVLAEAKEARAQWPEWARQPAISGVLPAKTPSKASEVAS